MKTDLFIDGIKFSLFNGKLFFYASIEARNFIVDCGYSLHNPRAFELQWFDAVLTWINYGEI